MPELYGFKSNTDIPAGSRLSPMSSCFQPENGSPAYTEGEELLCDKIQRDYEPAENAAKSSVQRPTGSVAAASCNFLKEVHGFDVVFAAKTVVYE